MVRALATRNRYSATSVDQLPHQLVAHLMYGHQLLLPVPDIDRTDYFLVLGANPMASNGSLMTVPDFPQRLRDLKARGGRMVVLDPRRTETAKVADEHHFVRPGTDAVVLLAMLHVLFDEGLDHGRRRTSTALDAVRDGGRRRSRPSWPTRPAASRPTSPPARPRARRRPAAAARRTAGSACPRRRSARSRQWAVQLLNLRDRQPRPGGRGDVHRARDRRRRPRADRARPPRPVPQPGARPARRPAASCRWRRWPTRSSRPATARSAALLTVSGNPVLSTPDGRRLDEALAGLDFMVPVDIYLNETTRHADVILPPTTALERDHYDLVLHALAVRNTARFTPAVIAEAARARGTTGRSSATSPCACARLGRKQPLKKRVVTAGTAAPLPHPHRRPAAAHRQAAALGAQPAKYPDGVDLGPLEPCLPGPAADAGQARSTSPAAGARRPARLRASLRRPTADELLLIGRRHQRDCNSWMHNAERLTKGKAPHQLLMHPDDLASRGLDDGAEVEVTSRVGKVVVEVAGDRRRDAGRGVAAARLRPPARRRHAGTPQRPGVSINDLTDPERLDVSGNAALSGLPSPSAPPERRRVASSAAEQASRTARTPGRPCRVAGGRGAASAASAAGVLADLARAAHPTPRTAAGGHRQRRDAHADEHARRAAGRPRPRRRHRPACRPACRPPRSSR